MTRHTSDGISPDATSVVRGSLKKSNGGCLTGHGSMKSLNHREMSKTGVWSLLSERAGHFCRRSELPHHGEDLPTENLAHLRLLVTGNKR